jgi:hypothetical protein
MPQVGFEPTIPASKLAKTVHPLDHSAAMTGPSCRWEGNIKTNVKEIVCDDVDLWLPEIVLSRLATTSFSRRALLYGVSKLVEEPCTLCSSFDVVIICNCNFTRCSVCRET